MGQGKSKSPSLGKSKSPSSMGVKLPPIPKDSPLGFMLKNWEHFSGTSGKDKAKMIHYCVEVWGGKEISKSVFWPIFGSSEDWVKQLLNIWVNTKQPPNPEESDYARVWMGRPEAFIFKLSAKSEGKKKGRPEELIVAPPPYVPPAPNAPPPSPPLPSDESDSDSDQLSGRHGPVTRSKTRGRLFPLREMPMGGPQPGIGFISVPLSSGDVRDFKKEMGNLLEDPLGVAERVDQFLGPNIYTWEELQSILNILFTVEEKNMIRTAGMRVWDAQPGHAQHPADTKWPLQNPNWNNQDPAHRANMRDFQTILIDGIRESVP
uniref:Core shell protein Gag P30 domain-containing protein n=1 Tax=Serinus canaria TaxID=9135 RepID=A0A8C9NX36_SERCA